MAEHDCHAPEPCDRCADAGTLMGCPPCAGCRHGWPPPLRQGFPCLWREAVRARTEPRYCSPTCKEWRFGVARQDLTGDMELVVCDEWPEQCNQCPHSDPDDETYRACDRTPGWLFAADPGWGKDSWGAGPPYCPYCGKPVTACSNQLADAAAAQEAWRAKQPGYRDAEPGVPDPTPQDVGDCADGPLPQLFEMAPINITGGMDPADFLDPDGARMDTLEDLVRQSAERGEWVVIDGRGSGTTVEWWPETASDEAPMNMTCGGTDVREALDKAKEGERGE